MRRTGSTISKDEAISKDQKTGRSDCAGWDRAREFCRLYPADIDTLLACRRNGK